MFQTAIEELEASGHFVSKPESFRGYCNRTNQAIPRDVPNRISVQTLSTLDGELRDSNVMVFRLGAPKGTRATHFGLAKTVSSWADYFFLDDELFSSQETRAFIPSASVRDLYAFSLMPRFTETTLVNFALASGLLAEALGLEEAPSIPVTGRSTYTFDFCPRIKEDALWTHHAGQVEIDGVFTARRNGRDCLFIVEAKHGGLDSLAKTKLLYPYLALRPHVPKSMPISLIYLRATTSHNSIIYSIAECLPTQDETLSPIDLKIENASRFSVTHPSR